MAAPRGGAGIGLAPAAAVLMQGSGEWLRTGDAIEPSEQFWADDEEEGEERSTCEDASRRPQPRRVVTHTTRLSRVPAAHPSLLPPRGGGRSVGAGGGATSPDKGRRRCELEEEEDSLYFCPAGAENRSLPTPVAFSNLPRHAHSRRRRRRSVTSSDSQHDPSSGYCERNRARMWRSSRQV